MYDEFGGPAAMGGPEASVPAVAWLAMIGAYFLFAYLHYRFAQKSDQYENAWWAFVPVMNTFLVIKMADKPTWWFLLLLVPVVNLVTFFVLWTRAATRAGFSGVWGFMALLPVLNLLGLGVLAFGQPTRSAYPSPTGPRLEGYPERRAG